MLHDRIHERDRAREDSSRPGIAGDGRVHHSHLRAAGGHHRSGRERARVAHERRVEDIDRASGGHEDAAACPEQVRDEGTVPNDERGIPNQEGALVLGAVSLEGHPNQNRCAALKMERPSAEEHIVLEETGVLHPQQFRVRRMESARAIAKAPGNLGSHEAHCPPERSHRTSAGASGPAIVIDARVGHSECAAVAVDRSGRAAAVTNQHRVRECHLSPGHVDSCSVSGSCRQRDGGEVAAAQRDPVHCQDGTASRMQESEAWRRCGAHDHHFAAIDVRTNRQRAGDRWQSIRSLRIVVDGGQRVGARRESNRVLRLAVGVRRVDRRNQTRHVAAGTGERAGICRG